MAPLDQPPTELAKGFCSKGWLLGAGWEGAAPGDCGREVGQAHILGQAEKRGARPAAFGGTYPIAKHLRQGMDGEGLLVVLGDHFHHIHAIEDLVSVLDPVVEESLTADRQHRIPHRSGGNQARHQVGDTWAGGDQPPNHLAGEPAKGLDHEDSVVLVAAEHQLHRRIQQGDEQAVDLGSQDAKHMGHPASDRSTGQGLARHSALQNSGTASSQPINGTAQE